MTEIEKNQLPTNGLLEIQAFFTKSCSYILFFEHMAVQTKFYCTLCDPKLEYPICQFCTACHNNCVKAGGSIHRSGEEAFICHCGKELRHEIRKPKVNPCNLSPIVTKYSHYLCYICNKKFCVLCNTFCHYGCLGDTQQLTKGLAIECSCEDNYHHLNDFLLHKEKINNILGLTKYNCPYQLIYDLVEDGIMDNLIELVKTYLRKTDLKKIDESERYKVNEIFENFNDLITIYQNYYFHNNLRELFNYEFMSNQFIQGKLDFYYFYSLYFIYSFELQIDFKFYTKFSAKDYLCTTITERLQNRTLFHKTISPEIQGKYKIYEFYEINESNSLVNFILKVAGYLDIQLEMKSLSIMLDLIEFGLSIHIFTIDKLIELITILYKKYDFTYNKQIIRNADINNQNIVETFTNILYMISMAYNDLVTLSLYNNSVSPYPYIHSYSEHGIMLYKLIVINMSIFAYNFSSPSPPLGSETLIINNESLKLFAITNNTFMNNLNLLRTEGFDAYNNFHRLACLGSDVEEQRQVDDLISKFKTALLKEYRNYYEKNEVKDINTVQKITKAFSSFKTECNSLFESLSPLPLQSNNAESKINKFRRNIANSTKHSYYFSDYFGNEKYDRNIFITQVRISSVVEVIVNLLSLNFNSNEEDIEDLILHILNFCKLLLFDHAGTSALLKGNFLNRLNCYFKYDTNDNILEFYTLLFKACKVYKINLTNCHYISLTIGNILHHLNKKITDGLKTLTLLIKMLFSVGTYLEMEMFVLILSFIMPKMIYFGLADGFKRCFEKSCEEKYSLQSIEDSFFNLTSKIENDNIEYNLITKFERTETDNLLKNTKKGSLKSQMTEISVKKESKTDEIKFYIAFLKLFTKNVFYKYLNDFMKDEFDMLTKYFPFYTFFEVMSTSFMNLDDRRHMVNYLVRLNFLEIIELHDEHNHFSTLDYENYINKKYYDKEKYVAIEKKVQIVGLLNREITNLIYFIYDSSDTIEDIRKYLKGLILNVKFVSEFIYLKKRIFKDNFSNHVTLCFFRLASALLENSGLLRGIFTSARDAKDTSDFKRIILNSYVSWKIKGFGSEKLTELGNFETLTDIEKIFELIFEEIQNLDQIISFLSDFDIKKFFSQYDKTFKMNFFTKGLVYEADNKVIKQQENLTLCKKSNSIYFNYINGFFDIDNTNMFYTLKNITTESYYNYRNIFIHYFISYIENSGHISHDFDIDMFLMVNKYLYFDGRNAQNSLQELLKAAYNNIFYPCLFKKLIRAIGLCYNTANNFFMQERFYKIINTSTQLILQFLQLLSEGYNLNFKSLVTNPIILQADIEYNIFRDLALFELTTTSFLIIRQNEKNVLRVKYNQLSNIEFQDERVEQKEKPDRPLQGIPEEYYEHGELSSVNIIKSQVIPRKLSYKIRTTESSLYDLYDCEGVKPRVAHQQKIKVNTKLKKNDMVLEEQKDIINEEFEQFNQSRKYAGSSNPNSYQNTTNIIRQLNYMNNIPEKSYGTLTERGYKQVPPNRASYFNNTFGYSSPLLPLRRAYGCKTKEHSVHDNTIPDNTSCNVTQQLPGTTNSNLGVNDSKCNIIDKPQTEPQTSSQTDDKQENRPVRKRAKSKSIDITGLRLGGLFSTKQTRIGGTALSIPKIIMGDKELTQKPSKEIESNHSIEIISENNDEFPGQDSLMDIKNMQEDIEDNPFELESSDKIGFRRKCYRSETAINNRFNLHFTFGRDFGIIGEDKLEANENVDKRAFVLNKDTEYPDLNTREIKIESESEPFDSVDESNLGNSQIYTHNIANHIGKHIPTSYPTKPNNLTDQNNKNVPSRSGFFSRKYPVTDYVDNNVMTHLNNEIVNNDNKVEPQTTHHNNNIGSQMREPYKSIYNASNVTNNELYGTQTARDNTIQTTHINHPPHIAQSLKYLTKRHKSPLNNTFYGFCYDTLSLLRRYIILDSSIQCTLPNDNLLILSNNLMNFLIEYNDVYTRSDFSICELLKNDEKFWRQLKWLLFNRDEGLNEDRTTVSRFIKVKYLQLLISLAQNSNFDSLLLTINRKINIFNLYEEIIYYMNLIIEEKKIKNLLPKTSSLSYEKIVNRLLKLYIFNPSFRKSPEFTFCLSAFKYIKICSFSFVGSGLDSYYEENKDRILAEKSLPNSTEFSVNSKAGYNVYKYFSEIIGLVEIKLSEKASKGVNNNKIPVNTDHEARVLSMPAFQAIPNEAGKTELDNKLTVFFVKPPITFLLTDQTKRYFMDNVDRTNGTAKHSELFRKTDYFVYEMLYNYKAETDSLLTSVYHYLRKMQMKYLEIFNYILILINQAVLINAYYKKDLPSQSNTQLFSESDKSTPNAGNIVFAIIHLVYSTYVIVLWSYYYAKLTYQKAIMEQYDIKYLISGDESKKKVKFLKFTDNFIVDNNGLLIPTDEDLSIYQKLNIVVFDLYILNRNINAFIFTFICLLVFLCSGHSIFIVLPVLFISNMLQLLSNILYAVKLKWKQLSMVLFFTYMLVYVFSWISFFYIYKVFDSQVFESNNQTTTNESLCSSSIQCWMNSINYGVRAGGGMGDNLPKISFYSSMDYFLRIFFFNMSYQIIIVLVLGNIFLGIIVDAFTELRDEKNLFDNDTKNICFICQITRDQATSKNINFDEHVTKKHLVWNYVDFIIYLFFNNPNDYNRGELEAYNKLKEGDLSWIPFEDNS
jgi:hypothetical protein